MSVSAFSPTRFPGSISGLLQVVSLLSLLLLLFKAAHFYLCRQWLLKAFQQFPCAPSHWLLGHKVRKSKKGTAGKLALSESSQQSTWQNYHVASMWSSRSTQWPSQAVLISASGSSLYKKLVRLWLSSIIHSFFFEYLSLDLAALHLETLWLTLPEFCLLQAEHPWLSQLCATNQTLFIFYFEMGSCLVSELPRLGSNLQVLP